jgi:hypothetical protein
VPAAPVELTVRSYGVSAVQNLPVITVMHNCKSRGSYKGVQTPAVLEEYAAKLVAPAARVLESLADTQAFADRYNVSVIGFFGGGGAEEDEEEDFREAAEALRYSHDVYFGVVRTASIVKHFRDKAKWFKRTPSIVVLRNYDRGDQDRDMLLMTEHNDHSLASWILTASVRLADEVNAHNFAYYESLRLPMLMLFVNKTLDNTELLRGFKNAAKDHQRRISFVWIDGELYASRKARARPRGSPPHPPALLRAPQHPLPYQVDTSRPSLRTNWTCLVPPSILMLPLVRGADGSRARRWPWASHTTRSPPWRSTRSTARCTPSPRIAGSRPRPLRGSRATTARGGAPAPPPPRIPRCRQKDGLRGGADAPGAPAARAGRALPPSAEPRGGA